VFCGMNPQGTSVFGFKQPSRHKAAHVLGVARSESRPGHHLKSPHLPATVQESTRRLRCRLTQYGVGSWETRRTCLRRAARGGPPAPRPVGAPAAPGRCGLPPIGHSAAPRMVRAGCRWRAFRLRLFLTARRCVS
jgi:hypothetical protein